MFPFTQCCGSKYIEFGSGAGSRILAQFGSGSRFSWVSELLIHILNLTSFASILTYICMCGSGSVFRIRIQIQEAPEYGSNTDPDPQHYFYFKE